VCERGDGVHVVLVERTHTQLGELELTHASGSSKQA